MALALPVAFSDPVIGGAGWDTNTDFRVPLSRPNESNEDEKVPRLPKFAFLSKEELSQDSGYCESIPNTGNRTTQKTKKKISPRSMENLKSDSGIEVTSSRNVDYMTKELEAMRIDREDTDLTASEDSSDEYDTDIEPTDDIKHVIDLERHVGRDTYLWACEDTGAAPMKAVLDNLGKPDIKLSGRNMGTKGAIALSHALKKNSRVVTLDLSDNGMGPQGGTYMATALADNEFILNVDLSQNQLGVLGALALGDMLKQNRGMRILNLSKNDFNEEAAQYIGIGLELNERLEELDISYNCLCETGGQAMGKALERNDSIERLNVSHNHIRRSGGVAIFKALQTNYALTSINISWNGIGYEGALALSEMLKVNRYITDVDVRHCRINWKGALLISNGLKQNAILEVLKIGGNPVTTTGTMDLIEAVGHQYSAVKLLDISEVLVIYEFEMMAKAIQQTRPDFTYTHGGIVNSHDIIGQRLERRVDPMQRVMDYMKERELRPTELFRSFDKAVKSKLTKKQFANRIQSSGIKVASWEIDELLETLTGKDGDTSINYQNLASSVSNYIEKERLGKIKERQDQKKQQEYHERIMNPLFNPLLPPIVDEINPLDSLAAASCVTFGSSPIQGSGKNQRKRPLSRVGSLNSIGGSVVSGKEGVRSFTAQPGKPKIISMSTKLGGKVKAFGSVGPVKKKKKRTKKKGKKKKR